MKNIHKFIPPCPDPDKYVLVKGEFGYYWRRIRGTVNPAKLNPMMTEFAGNMKECMSSAGELVNKLQPYTENFHHSHNTQRFAAGLNKALVSRGKMNYSYFDGMEIHKKYPIATVMSTQWEIKEKKKMFSVHNRIRPGIVDPLRNRSLTHFCFELILVSGDPANPVKLRTESDRSDMYEIKPDRRTGISNESICSLSVLLPDKKPFMVLFKVAGYEKNFLSGSSHHAMRVIRTG